MTTKLAGHHRPVLVFHVDGLAGARSANLVREAVKSLDPNARAWTDVANRRLKVLPDTSDAEDLVEILSTAGFVATLISSVGLPRTDWTSLEEGESVFKEADLYQPFVTNFVAGGSTALSLLPVRVLGPLSKR